MAQSNYPLPAFYFSVQLGTDTNETSFQEVSGLAWEMDTEEVPEGGVNTFVHRLPKTVKHPKLVLKRGVAATDSTLVSWCSDVLVNFLMPIETRLIQIKLLNEEATPVRVWTCDNAFPLRWETDAFNATRNELAIEKIEFSYSGLTRDD